MSDQLTDNEIVSVVIGSDRERYHEIVERYQERLIRYAISLVKDHEKAQDIVQDVFIKAYKNLRGFNPKYKFSSWIYRIAHNEALNYIRKNRLTVSLSGEPGVDIKDDSESEPEMVMDRKLIKERVGTCLSKLPLQYREPIELYFLEDESYESISDILRIPMGTVAVRISRGKKILKKICDTKNG